MRGCRVLTVCAAVVPLTMIALAAALSGWFDLVGNALSDLGHATRSNVAPIFNLGLSAGGMLLALSSSHCAARRSRVVGVTGVVLGFLLVLIAVFDEVYGRLHFYVSVAFFATMAVFLLEYAAFSEKLWKRLAALAAFAATVASWALHFSHGVPSGAAIPELISIAAALPFYLDYAGGA